MEHQLALHKRLLILSLQNLVMLHLNLSRLMKYRDRVSILITIILCPLLRGNVSFCFAHHDEQRNNKAPHYLHDPYLIHMVFAIF